VCVETDVLSLKFFDMKLNWVYLTTQKYRVEEKYKIFSFLLQATGNEKSSPFDDVFKKNLKKMFPCARKNWNIMKER